MVLPLLSYTEQSFVSFLLLCLLVGLLGSGLVALVQAVDHIVGNVEPLVGQQDVVALLGEDHSESRRVSLNLAVSLASSFSRRACNS